MSSKEGRIVDTGWKSVLNGALREKAPYYAKVIAVEETKPGCWEYLRVGIFDRQDNQLGEYKYNYHNISRTFHPFELRGKWYALYSRDYTATRVMTLPDCKDIGGEEPESWGFCPVDYYVPTLEYIESVHKEGCPRGSETPDYTKACTCPTPMEHIWRFPDRIHGFVAGCVWGDDSSWKIQYLDLSRVEEGIIKREERFGYIELAYRSNLEDAVYLDSDGDSCTLSIAVQTHFDLKTGEKEAA